MPARSLEDTGYALRQAIDAYQAADRACAYYGLRALALHVRTKAPQATTLVLDWSDQGDYLTFCEALVDGESLDIDVDDDESFAANLTESNEYVWKTLLLPPPEGTRRRDWTDFLADIDTVLVKTDEPFTTNPT